MNSFDVAWTSGGISQSGTKLGHRLIETAIEIHEGMLWPKSALNFFASDKFAGPIQKKGQQLKWLFLYFDSYSELAKFG
jgi:hypothetical protein